MKSKILILSFLLSYITSYSQTFQLKITGTTPIETKIIDSVTYKTKHQDTKQVINEINLLSKRLTQNGYLENQILKKNKENDSSYSAKISLGSQLKNIHIYIGIKNTSFLPNYLITNQDSIILPYSQTESFLKHTTQNLEQNGFAFAKVKLINIQNKKQNLYADLSITTGTKRVLNTIEIKYSNEQQKKIFPKGAKKQISKKYKNTLFNQQSVKEIYAEFEKFNFVNQIKFPEILFTNDTTKVFVYLEKRKANNFDGYIGFNNSQNNKIRFNGYLDLTLTNSLKHGEELSIYWKNDGNNQKLFTASLDIPYLLNTSIALKAQINIFKQDSIFQNSKTDLHLGYSLDYSRRIYLGYESTESSEIQNSNTSNLTDFKNTFYTTSIEIKNINKKNTLFPIKSCVNIRIGTGNRSTTTDTSLKQNFGNFNIMNDFYINEKNIINVKNQNYYLKSESYLTNELFRFGGVNSIRGFTENSLQANLMIALITEYRYLISPNLYFNSILDYCYYQDPTAPLEKNKNEKLLGIGLGFGLQTLNGLLKFAITNGKTKNEEIKFYNTNITISYNVKF
ncbi:hypothetical protein [Flavobacterium taihuense]|uniref:hypothetical protein n=1 Tax=Flavobacterium taihuense TaxID=2857508 RepID=UPI002103A86C|nr:hypothetical protein [Flavobacterium taihuense]